MKVFGRIFITLIVIFIIIYFIILGYFVYQNNKITYTAEDFGIETVVSKIDYDNDGIDDYKDILQGAKIEAKNKPTYKSAYYAGGYPPDSEGVCTDVIWRSLKNAGYNVNKYPRVNGKPDPNIDFRRVPNLKVYFERNHKVLTTDLSKIEQWQPGDIVVFGSAHIGIISDKRNDKGTPYLIHNGGQPIREEDFLETYDKYEPISGHYRLKEN